MFEDSTFESTGRIRTRSRRWMLVTFALNGSVLLALILIPLIYPEALPGRLMSILLTAPPPPAQPAPQQQQQPAHTVRVVPRDETMTAPPSIPRTITMVAMWEVPAPGWEIPGAELGGPGPGIPGCDPFNCAETRPAIVVRHVPQGPAHVSSGVAEGLLILKTVPRYPPIAVAARMEGTVILQAVISKSGTIENLRVVSGSPMLQQSAIDTVRQWRYRPYMLNGEPVEVETTINVIFSLSH
jgi:protein TonB